MYRLYSGDLPRSRFPARICLVNGQTFERYSNYTKRHNNCKEEKAILVHFPQVILVILGRTAFCESIRKRGVSGNLPGRRDGKAGA